MIRPKPHDPPVEREQLTPVREVFASLADELEHARALGLRVEGAICAIAVRSAVDGGIVSELQQLDAILQHLAALRDFAAELARQDGAGGDVATRAALERISLAEVRTRLGGDRIDDDPNEIWEML